jgi:hypothetical protein
LNLQPPGPKPAKLTTEDKLLLVLERVFVFFCTLESGCRQKEIQNLASQSVARIRTLDASGCRSAAGCRSTPPAAGPRRRPKPRAAAFSTADAAVCPPAVAIFGRSMPLAKAAGHRCLKLVHAPRQSHRPPLPQAGPRPSPKPPAAAVYTPAAAVPTRHCCLHAVDSFIPLEQLEKVDMTPSFCFIN